MLDPSRCPSSCAMFPALIHHTTRVFAVCEGPDSAVNRHVALDQYGEQINNITAMTWRLKIYRTKDIFYVYYCRGKSVRVFLYGDYDFLTTMHTSILT